MAISPSNNPYGNTELVDRLIGTAFDIVKSVAENLQYVKHVSVNLPHIAAVSENIEAIKAIKDNLDHIITIEGKLELLEQIYTHLAAIQAVYNNIEGVEAIAENMASLLYIAENIAELLAALQTAVRTVAAKTFTGIAGSNQTYELDEAPGSGANTLVFVGGIRQVPVQDYTVSGTTLTILDNPHGLEVDTLVLSATVAIGTLDGKSSEDFATAQQGIKADKALPADMLPIFDTATGLSSIDLPTEIKELEVTGYSTIGAGRTQYSFKATEPSHPGKFQDVVGKWYGLNERRIYVDMFGPVDPTGQVDSSAAFQKAADYARMTKCGRVWIRNGTYLVAGVIYGSFTIFTAENRGSVRLKVPSGANSFMFKTIGFDKWADSIPSITAPVSNLRSYRWHSSPAGRNSAAATNNYVVGTIIVTNPVDPGTTGDWENGEIWWQAISVNPATLVADRDIDWEQVPSLLGSIFSGFDGITFIGNSAGQDAPYKGICHYGVAAHFQKILGKDFGDWGLWWEVPGQVYSALVGIPLQGVWEDVRFYDCGTATSGNIYDNGQSDTTRFATMSYSTKNKGFMHYVGAKASGGRHYGFHCWTDDSTSNDNYNWAIWSDAQASDWHGHAEGRVRLNGARHSGEFKIYKGSSAFRQNAPAIYLNNPSHCDIVARTHLFRNCFRIVGADGGYNRLAGFLSESITGTGVVDLVFGATLNENTIVTALNNINASDRYQLGGPQNQFHRPSTLSRPAVADASDPTTGWSFSSQGLQGIVKGVEAFLITQTEFVNRKPVRLPSYTVVTLPTTGIGAGAVAYASNGRKVSEGAGSGTGVMVYFSSGQWRRFSDDSVVAA